MKEAGSSNKVLCSLCILSATFCGGIEQVGWGVSKLNRAASHTARLGSGQEAGVGAGPKNHGRGVYGFVGVAVGGDIVEKAASRGEVVLGGVGLMGRKLADSKVRIDRSSALA